MNNQYELDIEPQWARIRRMLQAGPKTTNDLCSAPGLAAEYRRALCDLDKILIKEGDKERVRRRKLTPQNWEYSLQPNPFAYRLEQR